MGRKEGEGGGGNLFLPSFLWACGGRKTMVGSSLKLVAWFLSQPASSSSTCCTCRLLQGWSGEVVCRESRSTHVEQV